MAEAKEPFGELPDIQKEAIEKFGTTNNPYDAGYILSNGKLLNMHSSPSEVPDLSRSGAIRFSRLRIRTIETALARFNSVPNERQIHTLKSAVVGVFSVSITFSDRVTGEPVVFKGKSLDVQITSPTDRALDDYFERVRKAEVFQAMNRGRI